MDISGSRQVFLALLPLVACLLMWAVFWLVLSGIGLLGHSVAAQKTTLNLLATVGCSAVLAHGLAVLACGRNRFAPLVSAAAAGVTGALMAVLLAAQRGVSYGWLPILAFTVFFTGVAWVVASRRRT